MPIGGRPIVAKPKQTLKLWQLYFSVINHQLDLFSNQILSDYLVYTKAISSDRPIVQISVLPIADFFFITRTRYRYRFLMTS